MQSSAQHRPKLPLDGLDPDHYRSLVRAIKNVLSTDLAEVTFAQLIDGLPLVDSVWGMRGSLLTKGHPLYDHDRLCEGAAEQIRRFRELFDPAILRLDAQMSARTLQSFQNAMPESREFDMRLAELVAAATHQIAVLLYESEDKLHKKDEIDAVVSWKKESQWVVLEGGRRILEEYLDPHPTLFYHINYMDHEQYPHGLADVAGYWAEDRILGGVTVFDRGESGTECKDIYFHSGRQRVTFRVWRLLDSQFDDMVNFLLAEGPTTSPFPILPSQNNRHRHDPWDAIALHHIFRDPWERKFPPTKPETRDVRSVTDYPELEDMFDKLNAIAEAHPETAYNWTASMEQQVMLSRWMPARNDGDNADDTLAAGTTRDLTSKGESQIGQDNNMSTTEDDADSLRCPSPPRTPPPPSPIPWDREEER